MKQLAIISILCLTSVSATAQEPCEPFLRALQERGYYDVALDYLEEMQTSELSSSAFKASIPFEKAQTLISSTSRIRDLKLLNNRLEEAQELLAQAEANSNDPQLKAKAQDYRGDLLFRRARSLLNLADNERLSDADKASYRNQARDFLEQALDATTTAQGSYKDLVDDFEVDLRSIESRRQQKLLRSTYTVVLVKRPKILEMYADTLEPGDSERTDSLKLAAREFGKLWDAYPTRPAGLDSCLYAARCHHKLGENDEAIGFLRQILALGEAEALRTLKLRAMELAANCWATTEPYPFDDVIANLQPPASNLTRRQERITEWQRIQLELARAYRAKADDLQQQGGDGGRIKNLNRDAAKLIKGLARLPGDHRDEARKLSASWNIKTDAIEAPIEIKPISSFADAKQQGAELLTEIQVTSGDLTKLQREFRSTGESDSGLGQQVAQTQQRLNQMAERCLDVLNRAMSMAGPKTAREDVNQIRYSQCVCRYLLKQHYEAALIGEFLVERYPTVPFSRQSAGIALRSCASLHGQAADQEKDFERQRLNQLAEKTVETWPGTAESNYAASTLTKLILASKSVSDQEIESVKKYVSLVSEGSPERSLLNVKLGTKLWFLYKNKKAAGEEAQQLSSRLTETIENLASGLSSYNSGNLNMEAAWASLFQVDALLEAGKIDEAVSQLEDSSIAPLQIVDSKPPILTRSKNGNLYIAETYKIAGKTYMVAMGESPDDGKWIEKAGNIVRTMSDRASESKDPASQQAVNNMFRLIAAQMQRQFDSLTDDAQLKSYANNLKNFIGTVQTESKDPETLIWAGRTQMKLADAFEKRNMPKDAAPFFDAAIKTLEKAAGMGSTDKKVANELKRQQALAKRGLGKYEEALNDLKELLKESPSSWNIQMDAAETLQRWGNDSDQANYLARSLSGTDKFRDPKTKRQQKLVWGWSQLVSALKSNPKYREPYYRCLFAEVETRLQYGVVSKKPKAIQSALKRLQIARAKDEALGGEVWQRKFAELEAQIIKNGATPSPVKKTN